MKKTNQNSTDASRGHSLETCVDMRKGELERVIAGSTTDERIRGELSQALAEINGLLTGDLDSIPKVIGVELDNWLEANKHLDEHHEAR